MGSPDTKRGLLRELGVLQLMSVHDDVCIIHVLIAYVSAKPPSFIIMQPD